MALRRIRFHFAHTTQKKKTRDATGGSSWVCPAPLNILAKLACTRSTEDRRAKDESGLTKENICHNGSRSRCSVDKKLACFSVKKKNPPVRLNASFLSYPSILYAIFSSGGIDSPCFKHLLLQSLTLAVKENGKKNKNSSVFLFRLYIVLSLCFFDATIRRQMNKCVPNLPFVFQLS